MPMQIVRILMFGLCYGGAFVIGEKLVESAFDKIPDLVSEAKHRWDYKRKEVKADD